MPGLRQFFPPALGFAVALAVLAGCDARLQPLPAALEQNRVAGLAQRLADAREVENLAGQLWRTPVGEVSSLEGLFALDEADVAIEYPGEARAVGREAVARRLAAAPLAAAGTSDAPMNIVEVASDALTAQALWGRLGVDFKKVNGQWKVWHWHLHAAGAAVLAPKPFVSWAEAHGY